MMPVATGAWITSVALPLVGCVFENDGGRERQAGACRNVDVCDALPVERVNSALGGPFSFPVETNLADGSSGVFSDECTYAKPGTTGLSIVRTCYGSDEFSSTEFDQQHMSKVFPPVTSTDLTGVGDRALVLDIPNGTPDANGAALVAIKGEVVVRINDNAVRADQNVHEGLATLANLLFAQ